MRSHEKSSSLSGSVASSMSSLHGVSDLTDVKDVVKDLAKRLEILEKVFLFVDFEQIRELVDKFSQLGLAPTAKAGVDRALNSTSPQSSLAEQTIAEEKPKATKKSRPKVSAQAPVAAEDGEADAGANSLVSAASPMSRSSANASETQPPQLSRSSSASRLQPLKRSHLAGPLRTTHLASSSENPAESSASLLQAPKPFHACIGQPCDDDEEDADAETARGSEDVKSRIQFGLGLTSSTVASTDVGDPMSTTSSWNHSLANESGGVSARADLNGRGAVGEVEHAAEPIDSERLSNFMKQATRPRFRQQFQGYR